MAPLFRLSGAAAGLRRVLRTRGGSRYPDGWFGRGTQEGPNGHLFGETPLPPGVSRKWEDWELPYYASFVAATVMLTVGLSAKPDTTLTTWARQEALRRMSAAEGEDSE
ncbi:hypothetical protein CBR_g8350 [Chara braunii]|uniref:NADH dehydrogenase [ubiquinone] 1 beta subcomplex subunit 11, mitochondrial n=1 Tax=Chara braunii TaxID=69332 RepID=A0A388KLY0_CHABU|nr:hypothetical protein CBR_g8350 [Chara braunii]|eukprot:GBG71051.1 hypothetical protein CBR_g8350 [Chara braunii]